MSPRVGQALEFGLVARESGQMVQILVQNPGLHDTRQMWVCEVQIRIDKGDLSV